MLVREEKKRSILADNQVGHGSVYRGILELMGRFGYVSKEEVMYGFELSEQDSRNRLNYLVRQELVRPFPSLAMPQYFYCLTNEGLAALHSYAISDEIHEFNPETYRPYHQKHDRMLIRIFCALKKTLGSDFQGWLSERSIRKGESLKLILEAHKEKRVLDGLFQMRVHKKRFTQDSHGDLVFQDSAVEPWWCGLELELSIKSKSRYQKQFKALSECVYDRINEKQKIPLMLFLCGSSTIQDTLIKYQQENVENFGRCIFIFCQADQLLKDREKAVIAEHLGTKFREIIWEEINHVKTKVIS
jgi:hypothetical protein